MKECLEPTCQKMIMENARKRCGACSKKRADDGRARCNKERLSELAKNGWKNDKAETKRVNERASWRRANGYGDPADGNGYE